METQTETEVLEAPDPATDLSVCPEEIRALDPNANILWVKFLRRTGIPMSAKSKKGKNIATDLWVDNNCRRAAIIRNFGIASLLQRLPNAKNEVDRAKAWWREAAACSEGDTIPDLSSQNMCVLNPFIVTKSLKFVDVRFEKLTGKTWMDDATSEERRAQNTRKRIKQARAGRMAAQKSRIPSTTRFLAPAAY